MNIWESILLLATGCAITLFSQYIKNILKVSSEKKKYKYKQEREAFELLLETHSKLVVDKRPTEVSINQRFLMVRKLILWSQENVLIKYAEYLKRISPDSFTNLKDRELLFGKTILEFKKQLKYKNKKLTPEQAAVIFKAAWKRVI